MTLSIRNCQPRRFLGRPHENGALRSHKSSTLLKLGRLILMCQALSLKNASTLRLALTFFFRVRTLLPSSAFALCSLFDISHF